ncbi:zinc-dependent alcohol dehydrogenase [Maledivibacter halophilus]|nr:alcohol dehydrogenase catalytic domain-containing protein [Maledivibacter halophilus]
MKALYFPELHKIELRQVEKPALKDENDVIVKITLTTICGSDLHIIHGAIPSKPGFVLGHEYVGVIEEVGSAVKNFQKGDRVIGPPVPFCGKCDSCHAGDYAHCNAGIHGSSCHLWGTHAEYMRVPNAEACLVHVPDELSDEDVIFTADILSTGYSAVMQAKVKPLDTVVIFGAGPVGLSALAAAKLYSPREIILVGRKDKFRLNVGKKIGATDIIVSSEEDVISTIKKLTNGRGADVAIDAVGVEPTIQQAVRCVGINGRVSVVGISGANVTLPLGEVFFNNISIDMGLGDIGHVKYLMNLIKEKFIDLSPLITHRMRLDEIEEAFKLFENRNEDVLKILVKP